MRDDDTPEGGHWSHRTDIETDKMHCTGSISECSIRHCGGVLIETAAS